MTSTPTLEWIQGANVEEIALPVDGTELTFGRSTDCSLVLDPDDRGISRLAGAIAIRDGQIVVRNLSSTRQIDMRERTGPHSLLAVGDTHVIDALPVTLVLTGAIRRHGLRLRAPGDAATPDSPSPPVDVGGAVTQGLPWPSQGQREALAAMLEGYLVEFPRWDPTPADYQTVAKRLGVTVTRTSVRRRIEEYRAKCKRAEIPGLEVEDARPVLARLVLSLGIITPADLQLLPARQDATWAGLPVVAMEATGIRCRQCGTCPRPTRSKLLTMRYFTSDQHLGHRNILSYADRPFDDLDAMADHLLGRWQDTVSADDEVWVLGDLAMGRMDASLALLGRLPGRIVLVPGNHDRVWAGWPHRGDESARTRERTTWRDRYRAAGISEVVDEPEPLTISGETVRIHHFPYAGAGDHTETERYTEWRLSDDGSWLLCGHIHDLFRQRGRTVNVGVDAWAGELVAESTVADLVASGPADRDPLPWPPHLGGSRPHHSPAIAEALDILTDTTVGDKALQRLRRRLGDEWDDALDALRARGRSEVADSVTARLTALDRPVPTAPASVLNGSDLIDLGVPAGPEIGALLQWLAAENAAGRLCDRDSAVDAVRARHLRPPPVADDRRPICQRRRSG